MVDVNLVEQVVHKVVVEGHAHMVLLEEGLHEFTQLFTVEEAGIVSIEFGEKFVDLFMQRSRVVAVVSKLLDVGG